MPVERIDSMRAKGLAQEHDGYISIVDVVGENIRYMILEPYRQEKRCYAGGESAVWVDARPRASWAARPIRWNRHASQGRPSGARGVANFRVQLTAAGIRAGQGIYELLREDGDTLKALGYFGEASLRLLGFSAAAVKVLKARQLSLAALRSISIQVGASRATVTVSGNTAIVVTDYAHTLIDRSFFAAITDAARSLGATRMVVNTGAVHDIDLAVKLGEAAQTGRTIAGGTVTITSPPGTTQPSFRITWDSIPEVTR